MFLVLWRYDENEYDTEEKVEWIPFTGKLDLGTVSNLYETMGRVEDYDMVRFGPRTLEDMYEYCDERADMYSYVLKMEQLAYEALWFNNATSPDYKLPGADYDSDASVESE